MGRSSTDVGLDCPTSPRSSRGPVPREPWAVLLSLSRKAWKRVRRVVGSGRSAEVGSGSARDEGRSPAAALARPIMDAGVATSAFGCLLLAGALGGRAGLLLIFVANGVAIRPKHDPGVAPSVPEAASVTPRRSTCSGRVPVCGRSVLRDDPNGACTHHGTGAIAQFSLGRPCRRGEPSCRHGVTGRPGMRRA